MSTYPSVGHHPRIWGRFVLLRRLYLTNFFIVALTLCFQLSLYNSWPVNAELQLISETQQVQGDLPLPKIEHGPDPLNVSILDYANFSCTASNVDTILWLINGSAIETISYLVEKESSHTEVNGTAYFLDFLVAKDLNFSLLNGSFITCKGLQYSGSHSSTVTFSNSSPPALLLLQGILDPPKNLTVTIESDKLLAEWLPPYTLEGLNVSSYEGNFSVTTNNSEYVSHLQNFNAITGKYSFPAFDTSDCTVYTICVHAVSPAGPGKPACISTSRIGAPWKLKSDQISVDISVTNAYYILRYEFEQNQCAGERANLVTIDIDYATGSKTVTSPTAIDLFQKMLMFEVLLPASTSGTMAKSFVTLSNSAKSTISEPKYIDLLPLQDVNITVFDTDFKTEVMCTFSSSVESEACQIEYQCTTVDYTKPYAQYILSLDKIDNSTTSEIRVLPCSLPCSMYDLRVYDVYTNGKVADTPSAYVSRILCHEPIATETPSASNKPTVTVFPGSQVISTELIIVIGAIIFGFVISIISLFIIICICKKTVRRCNFLRHDRNNHAAVKQTTMDTTENDRQPESGDYDSSSTSSEANSVTLLI